MGANFIFKKGVMTGAHCKQNSAVNSDTAVENKTKALRFKTRESNKLKGLIQIMKHSQIKSYDELPLFLNAELVAQTLGVASSTAYELMHEKDFPAVRIGNRFVVPKEEFIVWIKKKLGDKRGG